MNKLETVKSNIKQLLHKAGITHATLEFESDMEKCENTGD
jgi:hypothetical protein